MNDFGPINELGFNALDQVSLIAFVVAKLDLNRAKFVGVESRTFAPGDRLGWHGVGGESL